jgi:hypothetical protein
VFFLTKDKSKCVSVGFYPAQNYQPLVDFGGSQNKHIIITPEIVESLAEHLPRMCESMCGNERYAFRVGVFRLTTIGAVKAARMYFDRHYLQFKLDDLKFQDKMFYVVHNQLKAYLALPDVMTFVISALGTVDYVETAPTASKSILHYQLHDELKTPLL